MSASFSSHLSQPYQSIRSSYDCLFESPNVGRLNGLRGSIYNLKSSYELPDRMYDQVNRWDRWAERTIDGLERRL